MDMWVKGSTEFPDFYIWVTADQGSAKVAYLESELVALKPILVLGVGTEALDFLSKYDKRLQENLTKVFSKQVKEVSKMLR